MKTITSLRKARNPFGAPARPRLAREKNWPRDDETPAAVALVIGYRSAGTRVGHWLAADDVKASMGSR